MLFRIVTTLFQHYNAVLRKKLSLRMVSRNITFKATAMRTASKSTDLISKKYKFARAAHFFVHFFAVVLHDENVKLLCYTSFFRGIVVCVHQKFCCLCSCSLCFHCRSFFTSLAASISHFLTAAMKFSCFSSKGIRLLIFQSLASAFSLLPT